MPPTDSYFKELFFQVARFYAIFSLFLWSLTKLSFEILYVPTKQPDEIILYKSMTSKWSMHFALFKSLVMYVPCIEIHPGTDM